MVWIEPPYAESLTDVFPVLQVQTSPDGTTIPPASQIIDPQSNTWVILNLPVVGTVYVNGSPAGNANGIILLLLFGGLIYSENTNSQWSVWTGVQWQPVPGDPRPVTVSPNDTTIPPAFRIVDNNLTIWTITGNQVARNGAIDTATSDAQILLWHLGSIYYANSLNVWSLWNGSIWIVLAQDPRLQLDYILQATGSRLLLGDNSGLLRQG